MAQAEGGPKLQGLGEGEELNQSLVVKHFVLMDQCVQQFVESFLRQKMGISSLCLALSYVTRVCPQVLSKSHGERWFFAVSLFPEHKSVGLFLSFLRFSRCIGLG